MSDPRKGRPSASQLERMEACEGSWLAEKDAPDLAISNIGESGTEIHSSLAGEVETLPEHAATVQDMEKRAADAAERLGFDPKRFVSHERLWFNSEFSGEVDRLYLSDTTAFIPDFKSGYRAVTPPVRNAQLAALAILTIKNKGVARVLVTIIPRFGAVPTPAEYDLNAAEAALGHIRRIIANALKPNAPRQAGDHCTYCRARVNCRTFREYAAFALSVAAIDLPSLPADRLAMALDRIPAANNLIKSLKAEARRRIEEKDEAFCTLYKIGEGDRLRTIINLPALFQRVAALGITVDQFTNQCSMDIGTVDKKGARGFKGLIHNATGLTGNDLNKKADELLEGFVVETRKAGSLEKLL